MIWLVMRMKKIANPVKILKYPWSISTHLNFVHNPGLVLANTFVGRELDFAEYCAAVFLLILIVYGCWSGVG